MKVAIINGPNLNLLGVREPEIYGLSSLDDINNQLLELVKTSNMNIQLVFFQSNSEGEIITKIQECMQECDGVIINPAAYTHTSVAILDALSALSIPIIEVHISNTHKREDFRATMITTKASTAVISGLGAFSYHSALIGMDQILKEAK